MKWMKGAKDGVVVAGGQGQGDRLTQLAYPKGVIVDHLGNAYVADFDNYRIMRWLKGSKQGTIIVGGNRRGKQLNSPRGLSFDRQRNLHVVYFGNNRVEKFEIINCINEQKTFLVKIFLINKQNKKKERLKLDFLSKN